MDTNLRLLSSYQDSILETLKNGANGAERAVLEELASLVIEGHSINPDFQKVANAIVAKAVLRGLLPPKKMGRPKDSASNVRFAAATMYFDLIDSGKTYADAVSQVAERFHKDERNIMRMVSEHRNEIGETVEERNRKRERHQLYSAMEKSIVIEGMSVDSYRELVTQMIEATRRESESRDRIRELDEQIKAVLTRTHSVN